MRFLPVVGLAPLLRRLKLAGHLSNMVGCPEGIVANLKTNGVIATGYRLRRDGVPIKPTQRPLWQIPCPRM